MLRDGTLFSTPTHQGLPQGSSQTLVSPQEIPENARDWAKMAKLVNVEIAGAPHGSRDARFRASGERHEYNPYYIRRAVACLKFAESLVSAGVDLRLHSLTTVEALKRMAEVDFKGAIDAAIKLGKKELSNKDILNLEETSRRKPINSEKLPLYSKKFRDLLVQSAKNDYENYYISDNKSGALKPALELIGRETDGLKRVAVVNVGPFHSATPQPKQIKDKVIECLAFMSIYHEVRAAFANEDIEISFKKVISELSLRSGTLKYWSFKSDDYTPQVGGDVKAA